MKKRIMVDPGHGGHDSGAVAFGYKEKDWALDYAKQIAASLAEIGYEVRLTRTSDVFIPLSERARMANAWPADVFISVHFNAASAAAANGLWVIHDDDTKPEAGVRLAHCVFKSLAKIPGLADNDPAIEVYPDKTGWVANRELTVVSDTNMVAILLELGFLTNAADVDQLKNPLEVVKVADAVAMGVLDYHADSILSPTPPKPEIVEREPYRPAPQPKMTLLEPLVVNEPVVNVVDDKKTVRGFIEDVAEAAWENDEVRAALGEGIQKVLNHPKVLERLPKWLPVSVVKWILEKVMA